MYYITRFNDVQDITGALAMPRGAHVEGTRSSIPPLLPLEVLSTTLRSSEFPSTASAFAAIPTAMPAFKLPRGHHARECNRGVSCW